MHCLPLTRYFSALMAASSSDTPDASAAAGVRAVAAPIAPIAAELIRPRRVAARQSQGVANATSRAAVMRAIVRLAWLWTQLADLMLLESYVPLGMFRSTIL